MAINSMDIFKIVSVQSISLSKKRSICLILAILEVYAPALQVEAAQPLTANIFLHGFCLISFSLYGFNYSVKDQYVGQFVLVSAWRNIYVVMNTYYAENIYYILYTMNF